MMVSMAKESLSVMKYMQKMLQKPNYELKKIQILGKKGINSKLKHKKSYNSLLSGKFGDLYGRPGDSRIIPES